MLGLGGWCGCWAGATFEPGAGSGGSPRCNWGRVSGGCPGGGMKGRCLTGEQGGLGAAVGLGSTGTQGGRGVSRGVDRGGNLLLRSNRLFGGATIFRFSGAVSPMLTVMQFLT